MANTNNEHRLHRKSLSIAAVMVTGLVSLALILPIASGRDSGVETRRTLDGGSVQFVLSSDKEVYAPGEQPLFRAVLRNNTGEAIVLVKMLDGSDFGRYPLVGFQVTAPANAGTAQGIGRCGNTNPITPDAFVRIAPGETFDLLGGSFPILWNEFSRGLGEYRVRASYSTDEPDIDRWLGGPVGGRVKDRLIREIAPILAEVPRVTVESNELFIRIENAHAPG